jgi:hypothetical protein
MDNLRETLTELKNMLSDAMITQIDLDLKIKLVCKLNEALRIHDVVGRSEQLAAFLSYIQQSEKEGETIINNDEFIEGYLKSL